MAFIDAPKPPLRIYRHIGLAFIFSTVIMLVIVMYMALSRATIFVEPKEETVAADFLVAVKEENLQSGDILGKVGMATLSREASFPSSGDGEEMPAKAAGEVTIYNNAAKNQTLVGTTRLLSKSGILFRLQKTVNVPAGGSVKTAIAADKEGKSGEIGPSTFTIPGLAAGLQSKIYAKSEEAMTGGVARTGAVTEKDIEDAAQNIRSSLLEEAMVKLKNDLNGGGQFAGVAFKDSFKTKKASANPGDRAPEFTIKIELEVVGVAYSSVLQDLSAKTLAEMISADRRLTSSNLAEAKPSIEKYDLQDKSANFKVSLTGNTVINAASPIFDREKLAGMNPDEVKNYLEKYAGIKNVEIKFFPFWLNRVPKLRDHIKVIVR